MLELVVQMVQHWIFISMPFSDFNTGDSSNVIKKAQKTGIWSIGSKTNFRKQLAANDRVLIYEAGEEGRRFLADGVLASNCLVGECSSHYVSIKDIMLWDIPLPMYKVLNRLTFIKNKKHWGLYFQNGITRINEKDFNFLLAKKNSLLNTK